VSHAIRLDPTPAATAAAISTLQAERSTLIVYMRKRMDREDWHGVMDASADIREIEAKLAVLVRR